VIKSQFEKPIRLVFYEPYPTGLGGNFLTQRLILERLDSAHFIAVVVAPVEGVALQEFRKMGVECLVIPPPGNLIRYGGNILRHGIFGRMKTVLDLLRYNIILASFLRARQIDVVYANSIRAVMCIGFACKFVNCRLLLYVKEELQNPLIDRISFWLSDRILFMSKFMLNSSYSWIGKLYRHKVEILRGGVDQVQILRAESNDKKTALIEDICIDTSKINTLVIGQLNRPKGQHLLIHALKNLIKDHNNVRLYIVGDEVIKEYSHYKIFLKSLVADLKLGNYVHFLEWRKDALTIMALMDIIINPSFTEGFGYVVVESMLLARPVIASKTGIAPEIIRDGKNGFLVDIGDEAAIERRWRELVVDPELRQRLGRVARETVFAEYLIDDKVVRLAEIWTAMVHGKG
jgi:glycosyltransferase involved in cell wall biosynthesis